MLTAEAEADVKAIDNLLASAPAEPVARESAVPVAAAKPERVGVYYPPAGRRLLVRPKPEPVPESDRVFSEEPVAKRGPTPTPAPSPVPVVAGIDVEADEDVKAARANFTRILGQWQAAETELRELSARFGLPAGQQPKPAELDRLIVVAMLSGGDAIGHADIERLQSLMTTERCSREAASRAAAMIPTAIEAARRKHSTAIAEAIKPELRDFALAWLALIRASEKLRGRVDVFAGGGFAAYVPGALQHGNITIHPGCLCSSNPGDAREPIRALVASGVLPPEAVADIPAIANR